MTAPTLDTSKTPVLNGMNEDAGLPSGAVGTLISALVDLNPPAGGLDNVTDSDSTLTGIALTAVGPNGRWWFTTNGGTNWFVVGPTDFEDVVSKSECRR